MKLRSFAAFAAVMTILTGSLLAGDVSGKWKGEVTTQRGTQEMTIDLKAAGDAVTGSVTNQRGSTEISDGKVSGDMVSFKTKMSFGDREVVFVYTGKVTGDSEIEFERKMDGAGADSPMGRPVKFTAKKQ